MKRLVKYLFAALIVFVFAISVCAKETVIVNDDFSSNSLHQYNLNGTWTVSDGKLKLGEGTGSAYLYYDFPDQYKDCNYKIEVDFIGHTSTGGILIGGSGSTLTPSAPKFHGFDCFLGGNGKKAALGCYKADGEWSGNIIVSDDNVVTSSDVHLSVEVYDNELVYRVTSIDGKTLYYGVTYTIGTSTRDVYEAFSSKVGLRKFYADKGAFDNLKITVIEEDKLPSMSQKVNFGGFAFKSNGLKLSGGAVSGNGAMLTDTALSDNFKAEFKLTPKGNEKIYFGMTDVNNGYAFEIDKTNERLAFYQITNGKYNRLGVKNMPVYDGEHLAYVEVTDGVATVMFDTFFEEKDAFWSFSFRLSGYKAGKFGALLSGGSIKELSITETDSFTGEAYVNPVNWGPDPDIMYYDGTYYLYNRITSGNDIFRVYTSPDMVTWTARNTVFVNDPAVHNVQHYMSPNVIHYNGTFYLFYAAKNTEGSNRLFCATSDSPYGPFTHKHGQIPLHDVPEIGGHPYIDESGKVYISCVRFGNGNHIWLEEIILADDKATPVPGTLTKVISPSAEYENDGHGHIAEGGVLYKHNGYYYMIYATGHYEGHYGETYAVSKNILGPYTKYEYGDILTWNKQIDGTGDGVFVKSPDGTELWMVYHKHYAVGTVSPRYTCVDKIKFVKDPSGGPDILTVQGPSTTPQAKPSNIYRYDINRDGVVKLMDALYLLNNIPTVYNGVFDPDCNNRIDEYDAQTVLSEIVK